MRGTTDRPKSLVNTSCAKQESNARKTVNTCQNNKHCVRIHQLKYTNQIIVCKPTAERQAEPVVLMKCTHNIDHNSGDSCIFEMHTNH